MRIAVFSDVHGNAFALAAVLDAIAADGPFDRIIAAGDLAFGGSDPARCIDLLREAGVEAVYGNTDEFIFRMDMPPGDDQHLKKWSAIREDAAWAIEKLGPDRIWWLAELPFDLRLDPTDRPPDRLLVFHANPEDVEGVLYPGRTDQENLFGRVLQPDDDPQLTAWLDPRGAGTMAFGHFHYSSERTVRGKRLVNVAPVSMPAIDRAPQARYSVFDWDGHNWELHRRFVVYDYTQEIAALAQSGMPHWETHAGTFPGRRI
jgi:predicted phosphodiesterase